MSNVFTIVNEYESLMAQLEESGGELTPELEAQLIVKEDEIAKKIRAYHKVILIKLSEIELCKAEAERLDGVKRVKENAIQRIKKYVDLAVETFGTIKPKAVVKSIDLGDLKVWQKKTESLEITGIIDDSRFCERNIVIKCDYDTAKKFYDLLKTSAVNYNPTDTIKIINDKLKQWLLDDEEAHNKIRANTYNIPLPEEGGATITDEQRKDLRILLNSRIKHNSTIQFK